MAEREKTRGSGQVSRRSLFRGMTGVLVGSAAGSLAAKGKTVPAAGRSRDETRVRQSVCRWCFDSMDLRTLAQHAVRLGLQSIELVSPEDWPVLREHGLSCAMTPSHDLFEGLNRKENHPKCRELIRKAIDANAEAGFPNVVVLSGFRDGVPDDVGLENTVEGLKSVVGYAEKKGVNLCLEMINSRVDAHMKGRPGYMADTVEWAVDVCRRISSARMKILFDIYHVQVMQGDLITRIREYRDYIAHYHTGGVPGRNEIDETQEISYPAVMRAILETGFDGYVGHEFIPLGEPLDSLEKAVSICDV